MSSSSLQKKSDLSLVSKVKIGLLRQFLTNLQKVILGTKLAVLFPVIPLAIITQSYNFGRFWKYFAHIAFYTGPTVGGLLNATEQIIAIFALYQRKINIVKYSLLGSIISNLLLILGTSLFCGSLTNLKRVQRYDKKQCEFPTPTTRFVMPNVAFDVKISF
ncbi:hypothetical protein GIB67_032766 [Kingdonia uniflora]|uniref:Sodium/calcium exchanger membrane region domain-containing protein n=1 Tax=Kingdonia uniflora TaxID=39325 RepID=A0A7J7MW40_9MAGN|nr:hypothetical protein GIB67_032766 [Kingdonia uniflora]